MRWWSVCLLAASLTAGARAGSVFDLLSDNPDLSQFLDLVKKDGLVTAILRQAEGTVFAPTNAALQKYAGHLSSDLLKYHMVNLALSVEHLTTEVSVPTRLKGSQPVFITVPRPGDVFVNNARIVRSDLQTSSQDGQDQVMHIIDEVLEPTIPSVAGESMHFNPSALKLLANSKKYDLADASIEKFYQTIQSAEKLDLFSSGQFHTFFIPIDKYYDAVRDQVTAQVVDGHVIPNKVLFTRTMGDKSYRTEAFDEMLKVTIKLLGERLQLAGNSSESNELTSQAATENLQQVDPLYEAQSTILLGDIVLHAGSVLSRVVKPNIAVKNGVVHLIKKPLMLEDGNDVLTMIQEGENGQFHEFLKFVREHDSDFMEKLMTYNYFTIFIPSNEAFNNVDKRRLKEIVDSGKLNELLRLHVVPHKVTTEVVRNSAQGQPYSVMSEARPRSLYLSVSGEDQLERTLTVEGGGTSATVIVPDIGRSNGVIHIIDRFLGIPYQSVTERLDTDPLASLTSSLSRESGLAQQLKAADKVTLLVPSAAAWQRLQVKLPTSYKAILANRKSAEVLAVLQRHLVVGQALNITEMAEISAREGGVNTTTGQMVQVETIPGPTTDSPPVHLVKWQSLQATVVRADEECTNGYIHVIDRVLIGAKDVSEPSAAAAAASAAAPAAAASALLLAVCGALLPL